MKKILVGFTLLGLLSWSGCALAQSTAADVSARLIGKPLLLRGLWMDDKLQFDSAGRTLGNYKVGPFTESAFDVQKVQIDGGRLTIEGQRVALFFDADGIARRLPMKKKSKVFGGSPEKLTSSMARRIRI